MCKSVVDSASAAIDLMIQQDPESAPPKRPPFNKAFVPIFEYIFSRPSGHNPSKREKQFLAKLTKMTFRQIEVWFQNRRARLRKKILQGKPIPSVPTLEEALKTLRSLLEKQKSSSKVYKTVVFRRKRTYWVEDEDEDEYELSPRDIEELELQKQYESGIHPNIDSFTSPPGSFPDAFVQPIYSRPRFAQPVWPRSSPPKLIIPELMTDDDISNIAEQFERLQLYRKETVIEKEKIAYLLPLPPSIAKALEKRKKKRAERRARQAAAQAATQVGNGFITHIPSTRGNQVSTEAQPQTQVGTQVAAEPEEQIVPNLCTTFSRLIVGRKRSNISQRSSRGSTSNNDSSGSSGEESDDWGEEDEEAYPLISWASIMDSDLLTPEESSMSPKSMCLRLSQALKDTKNDPIWSLPMGSLDSNEINTMEDALPLQDVVLDDCSLNEVLLMTLEDIGYKGPLPPNFHEPLQFNYVPDLAPNPAAPLLEYLQDAFTGFEQEGTLPPDAGIIDLGADVRYEPNMWQEEEVPSVSTEPFPYFPLPQDSLISNQYGDFNVVSTSGQPLTSSETSILVTNVFEGQQIFYPQVLDHSNLAFNYDGQSDPFGTPFILQPHTFFHQDPSLLYSTAFEGMPAVEPPASYTVPPANEINPPPMVDPPRNKSWDRFMRSIFKLIGKTTKSKSESQSSVDPESMLQYLNF